MGKTSRRKTRWDKRGATAPCQDCGRPTQLFATQLRRGRGRVPEDVVCENCRCAPKRRVAPCAIPKPMFRCTGCGALVDPADQMSHKSRLPKGHPALFDYEVLEQRPNGASSSGARRAETSQRTSPAASTLLGGSHADRRSKDTVGSSVHRLYEHTRQRYEANPDNFVDLMGGPPTHEMARQAIVEFQFPPIPPEWIRSCTDMAPWFRVPSSVASL